MEPGSWFLDFIATDWFYHDDDDDDYDCGDGCHKSKWNMTLASSCTYTWCFWFWNKLISPSYIIFLDFQSSSTPRGVSRRQDKLQINTAPGDKAGGRQPQAAQVATAPPVVHKEPVSLGHQQDHMGCDWKLTWVPWWKAPMVSVWEEEEEDHLLGCFCWRYF